MNNEQLTPIIEFAGVPASGKTTTANLLRQRLSTLGLPVRLLSEAAHEAPLQHLKQEWLFNTWTLCTTLTRYLESQTGSAEQHVILDRGFLDSVCWFTWFRSTGRVDNSTAMAMEGLALTPAWFDRTVLSVVLRCAFRTARRRRTHTGRIFNAATFAELTAAYETVVNRFASRNQSATILVIDTDTLTPREVVDRVMNRLSLSA